MPSRGSALQVLRQVLWEPLFDQLRTKEQLGYSVSVDLKVTGEVSGLVFAVQAAQYNPDHLEARVECFLLHYRNTLATMTAKQFHNHVRGVLVAKLCPFNNQAEVCAIHNVVSVLSIER